MVQKSILVAAALLYVAVVGCALVNSRQSSKAAPAEREPTTWRSTPVEGLPIRAIGMQIQRVDWIDKYKQSIDEIADTGADAVKFVVDARQENGSSSRIYLDMRMTPSPELLGGLIKYAKSKNLRVILMPIVLLDKPRGQEWRGKIEPTSWDDWWDSYRDILNHFAWIAQANGVDVLMVGSELVSTEKQIDQWTKTINKVRQSFKGKLTYSSNWDHYTAIHFWDQLDLISMNCYWSLGKNKDATIDEIKASWAKIQGEVLAFTKKEGKPLFFSEVGWCSMSNMAHEPWDYTKDEDDAPTDLDLQRRLYEGFFESWHGRPELGGFSIWEWTPGDGGAEDRGYTPENKPAEEVLRKWLAKKW